MSRSPAKIILIVIACLAILFGLAGVAAYSWLRSVDPGQLLGSSVVQQEIKKRVGVDNAPLVDLLPQLMGFTRERTYLLLFQNNTEIRPGGGFIGSYAVVRVNQGNIELIILEGSEELDARTPTTWKPAVPLPLEEHLGVRQWFFRDANWDPDFVSNVDRGLEFYREQGGILADEIDLVAAIDTEVMERLLRVLGPVEAQGRTFTADNVIEVLQYDTSYGYQDRGIPVIDRKQLLDALFIAIADKLPNSVIRNYSTYLDTANDLIREKHIQLYSLDEREQRVFEARGIAGRIAQVEHDHLMWVDANLAALKTDHAIDRTLSYTFSPREDGRVEATAAMTYNHTGTFDWRTSRYRTYARVFVPQGSEFISASGSMRTDKTTDPGRLDQGESFSYTWFGTFISIEPGNTGTLSFTYLLPEDIDMENYQLLVEKQAGVGPIGLTLDLGFGTTIRGAAPAESESEWGDARYRYQAEQRTDQYIGVEL